MRHRRFRQILIAAAIAGITAPAAFAFLAEAAKDRTADFLEEIRSAQDRVRFAGRRRIETPEGSTVLDLRSDRPGRVHVDPVSRPSGRRSSGFGGRGRRFSDPALIVENYRLDPRGAERIAGREAERFALIPRHAGRSSYEFAVDTRTRFLLAFRSVGSDGARLYDARFESIEFDPPSKAEEKPAKPAAPRSDPDRPRRVLRERVTEDDLRRAMPFTVWRPSWAPAGFRRRSLERYRIRDLGEAVLERWSDGMSGIFIVQTSAANPAWELFRGAYLGLPETPPAAPPGEGPVAWRMRHPGGALLDLTLDDTEILISGQVDPADLKKMADHLRNLDR